MTFENHTRGEHHEQKRSEKEAKVVEKEAKQAQEDLSKEDQQLLQPKKTGHPGETTVSLAGGQPINDPSGLDISQYTGPGAKASSELNDPQAPYHQGPGSGLSQGEEAEGADWENPEPENDSF